jgi:hypothetical protein
MASAGSDDPGQQPGAPVAVDDHAAQAADDAALVATTPDLIAESLG